MEDLISVIVPVYNAEEVLWRALDCISNQTYRNLEIILVDDGSTDSSGRLCDAFAKIDSRCRVIHKPNGGQGSAKNVGKKEASGAFLFFPDGDDTFNLDLIRILHEAITKNPDYDLALSSCKIVDNWDTDSSPSILDTVDYKTEECSRDDIIKGLFSKNDDKFLYGWNKLYRRELLENLCCGDYPRHHDFDFNFRVFLQTRKAVFVDLDLYHWVQWGGSKTHRPDSWDIHYRCRTGILYDNWAHLAQENRQYNHYLLDALYRAMIFWEEWSRKSGNFPEVKALCDNYVKNSKKAYLKNGQIRLFRKVFCLTMLTFPSFSHFVMRLTSNAR